MKYALKCRSCGGEKIYAIKQASMPACHDARHARPLAIAATSRDLLQPSMLTALLEARVCDRCAPLTGHRRRPARRRLARTRAGDREQPYDVHHLPN